MVNAVIAVVLAVSALGTVVAATPTDPSKSESGYNQGYEECSKPEYYKKSWYDKNGKNYGWDYSTNKQCIVPSSYSDNDWKNKGSDWKKKFDDWKNKYEHDDKSKANDVSEWSYKGDDYKYKGDDYKYKGDDYKYKGDDYKYKGNDWKHKNNDWKYKNNDWKHKNGNDYKSYANEPNEDYGDGESSEYVAASYGGDSYKPDYKYKYGGDKYKEDDYTKYGYSCKYDRYHFENSGSPTLKQCADIACAYGTDYKYQSRALYQCYALEKQAKATNGGYLPYGW